MATKAQLEANRKNAEKSTGPKTAEGKAAVSHNALKHGLFAQEAVIYGESQAEFELRREAFLAEWRPVGPTESMLAERIVSLSWRLLRAERIQNQTMDCMILREVVGQPDDQLDRSYHKAYGISPDDMADSEEYLPLGRITVRWMDNSKLIERLFMHERRIESSLERTMTYLKKLQIMRRIERDDAAEKATARAPATEQHNGNFAKQSQFFEALVNARAVAARDYDDRSGPGRPQNKANRTQSCRAVRKGAAQKTTTERATRPITG